MLCNAEFSVVLLCFRGSCDVAVEEVMVVGVTSAEGVVSSSLSELP